MPSVHGLKCLQGEVSYASFSSAQSRLDGYCPNFKYLQMAVFIRQTSPDSSQIRLALNQAIRQISFQALFSGQDAAEATTDNKHIDGRSYRLLHCRGHLIDAIIQETKKWQSMHLCQAPLVCYI